MAAIRPDRKMVDSTSLNGTKAIACREAVVTIAYPDGQHADGTPKYSIGIGSQRNDPKPGDVITIKEAFARLRLDISDRDKIISKALKVEINQYQWDALSSLFYQSGTKALQVVTNLFNVNKPILAVGEFMRFNCGANGIPTDGHTKRRIREMILAIDGYYGDLTQVAVWNGDPKKVPRQFMPFPEDI